MLQATPINLGRPAGEVRQALLHACEQLATDERGLTLQELAMAAQVGLPVARRTVDNLRRAGLLAIARARRVAYRNRPVAEYVPGAGWVDVQAGGSALLAGVLNSWGR